jgi:hypothetical protein
MVKLVFSWNIKGEEEPAYFEFIVQEFAPKIARMGIRLTEAWYTMWGSGPQIIMPGLAEDRITLNTAIESSEWLELVEKLGTFVSDYKLRVLGGA